MVTWRENNVLFNVINKLKLTLRKQVKYNNLYIKISGDGQYWFTRTDLLKFQELCQPVVKSLVA